MEDDLTEIHYFIVLSWH